MLRLRDPLLITDITNNTPASLSKTAVVTSPNPTFQQIGVKRNCMDVVSSMAGLSFSDFLAWTAYWHNIEAWAYMGKSLNALSSGNFNAFIHLCYYAELRAALSFFSLNGIFICEDGLVYEKGGSLRYNPFKDTTKNHLPAVHLGTHKALWKCFTDFNDQIPFDYYLNRMPIFGTNSKNILDQAMTGTGFHHNIFLKELFASASSDIFQRDRSTRNRVSYFPFHDIDQNFWCDPTLEDNIKFISQIIQPSKSFVTVDLFIVKQFLKSQFESYGVAPETFLNYLQRSFGDFFSTEEEYNERILTQLSTDSDIDKLLSEHVKHDSSSINYYKQILSRTLIFLRLNMIHFKESMTSLAFNDFETNHANFFKNRKSDFDDIQNIIEEEDYLLGRISTSELIKIAHLID